MKHKKDTDNLFARYLRYFRNEVTSRERNLFERELLKDPFADEAAEGFAITGPDEAERDLYDLHSRLYRRTRRKTRTFYRIAAAIAVIAVLSSLMFLIFREQPENNLALESRLPELRIFEGEPVIRKDEDATETKEAAKPGQQVARSDAEDKIADEEGRQAEVTGKKETLPLAGATGKSAMQEPPMAPVITRPHAEAEGLKQQAADEIRVTGITAKRSRNAADEAIILRGLVLSSDDKMPVAGASVVVKGTKNGVITGPDGKFTLAVPSSEPETLLVSYIGLKPEEVPAEPGTEKIVVLEPDVSSLSEVVITGYGIRKNEELENQEYTPPEPVIGRKAFNEYLDSAISRPDSANAGQRAVVVASFMVYADGTIDTIKILRSPGDGFSKEALRLLKEGPRWNPALRNGIPVDEEVRIRIVFK